MRRLGSGRCCPRSGTGMQYFKTTSMDKSHEIAQYLDASAVANQGVIDEQYDDCADYRD
jgi:hypothetical protein